MSAVPPRHLECRAVTVQRRREGVGGGSRREEPRRSACTAAGLLAHEPDRPCAPGRVADRPSLPVPGGRGCVREPGGAKVRHCRGWRVSGCRNGRGFGDPLRRGRIRGAHLQRFCRASVRGQVPELHHHEVAVNLDRRPDPVSRRDTDVEVDGRMGGPQFVPGVVGAASVVPAIRIRCRSARPSRRSPPRCRRVRPRKRRRSESEGKRSSLRPARPSSP